MEPSVSAEVDGAPADPQEALPNDPAVTDHSRGWKSTSSCTVTASLSWGGTAARTLSNTHSVPSAAHSRAGDHHIDSRYGDLSVLPRSHSNSTGSCTVDMFSRDTADNRKHDMCVSGMSGSAATTYTYSCTRTTDVYRTVNGTKEFVRTDISHTTETRTTAGSCGGLSVSGLTGGYRLAGLCSGGPSPPNPPVTFSNPGDSYSCSPPAITTNAQISSACLQATNTPHLDLDGTMSLRPGLNVYRPSPIPAADHMLVVYDDAAGPNGGTEYIQIYVHPGPADDPAGPYDFHLKQSVSGILYDTHRHYGWVDSRLYGEDTLASIGYTPHAAMAGHGDGLELGGGRPSDGTRLCHGDCLMGQEGIDGAKPSIRIVTPTAAHPISGAVSGLVYDHVNNRWFDSPFTGSGNQTVVASLYLVVPFAADTGIYQVNMYGHAFDPGRQNLPPRLDPAHPQPCHLGQSGQLHAFASSLNMRAGDSLELPVLPEVLYVAFIGDGNCFWYDVAALPSPLSGVSSGARAVPLVNGTILSGDLLARHTGAVHVDVVADFDAVWQSEMYGLSKASSASNSTWVVPPPHVNITAVARVNGVVASATDGKITEIFS